MAKLYKILFNKANLCIRLFLLIYFISLNLPAQAQKIDTTLQLQSSYNHFLNFELDSCSKSLEKTTHDPFAFYLRALISSAKVFVKDDLEYYKSNKSTETDLLDSLEKSAFSERYNTFLKSEVKLQWAILKLKNGDEFSAFWSLKQAYTLAEENVKKYPDFIPSYKTLGLLHVLYGVFPDKYNWILSLFSIDGDIEKGLEELDKVRKSDSFLSLEASITASMAYAYLLNQPEQGAIIMNDLHKMNKTLLVDYAYTLILMKNAQSNIAINIIDDAYHYYQQPFNIPQLYYVQAEILLQKGQCTDAIKFYEQFLSLNRGKNLIKDTYFKIGLCYLILNMEAKAQWYFRKSEENGWAKNEADKNAILVLESGNKPNADLLQLRFATDGGFYENALDIYRQIDTANLNNHDHCEYLYRSARLFHNTGHIQKASEYYQKTLDAQHVKTWYYAPNSALHLGLIFISKGEDEIAKKTLKLIDHYNGYPYQNSIRQKAKSALRQLN